MLRISFADDAIAEVLSGSKSETLRLGEDFPEGSVVEFVRQNGARLGFLRILEKSEVEFRDLSLRDVRTHNSGSLEHLRRRLLSFYPGLREDSRLSRYRFEFLDRLDDEEPNDR